MTEDPVIRNSTSTGIPLAGRLTHEIPKPKDWQAFQRNCTILFQAELGDPNAQEYGRLGQNQRGIDILGRRKGDATHYVGVQCRHISRPLTETEILEDCRAALNLTANLKEIIFATTAPDDTGATDAAVSVEKTLRAEGHDLTIAVYGWQALQNKIAIHDLAYAAFCPSIVAISTPLSHGSFSLSDEEVAARVADLVVEQLRQTDVAVPPRESDASRWSEEDPAVHARIDTYRDLFKEQNETQLAKNGFQKLLAEVDFGRNPWARFRIETNLGSVALDLGKEMEAAERFEAAYQMQPADVQAIANLSLARTIQGRFEEAMALAQDALRSSPRSDQAVAYLLQAAARSDWQGDPETLIPRDLVGSVPADIGHAEYLRRRNISGWPELSLELSRRHLDLPAFKHIAAHAILQLASENPTYILGGKSSVTQQEVEGAANTMKSLAERALQIGFANEEDLAAYLNNAAALLSLSGRHAECLKLLRKGIDRLPSVPFLRRRLALAQIENGDRDEALETLSAVTNDPECQLLGAELIGLEDPEAALMRATEIDESSLNEHLVRLRWRLIGDLALKVGDAGKLKSAVRELREIEADDISAQILEIQWEQKSGSDEDLVRERLLALSESLPIDAKLATRYIVAQELFDYDLPEQASALLEGHVDLSRHSLATTLYLECLAAARRDDTFKTAIELASQDVRDEPEVQWIIAAHAWNMGDLPRAYDAAEALLNQQPENPRARILKIEILIRQNRSAELVAELERPIEELAGVRIHDQFRIASLLSHFGYFERAADMAYRLFLEHRDNSQAWMTLSMLVLEEGRGDREVARPWDMVAVAANAAVDMVYDDGEAAFVVVESDPYLRQLDDESWEPHHPLVQSLMGRRVGDAFTGPTGRTGRITRIRHKYVARLHYVMENYEARFPTVQGVRKVPLNFEEPGGLDELIAELKARRDWAEQEQEQYRNGPWPLSVLAHRLGHDVIDVAEGLASQGIPLKVALGNAEERSAATQAVRQNLRKGCVLDLLAFWLAWRLQVLDPIAKTCGPIHLTQSAMDRLYARQKRLRRAAKEGHRTGTYKNGKIVFQEFASDTVTEWADQVDQAVAWAESNATICPLVAGDNLPSDVREFLRSGPIDVFDSIVVAMQSDILLITDDLATRELSRLVGGSEGTWLQQAIAVALNEGQIDNDSYVRLLVHLVEFGQSYISVSGPALVHALRLDAEASAAPGHHFKTLVSVIGGRNAEPRSHVMASNNFLHDIWKDRNAIPYREATTGILLRHLVSDRRNDYKIILGMLVTEIQDLSELVVYFQNWIRGHFLLGE